MRIIALVALLLPSLAASRLFADDAYLMDITDISTSPNAKPASAPTLGSPIATSVPGLEHLELRQVAAPVAAAPAVAPVLADPSPPAIGLAFPEALAVNSVAPAPVAPQNLATASVANPVAPTVPALNVPGVVAPLANPIASATANSVISAVSPVTTTPPSLQGDDFLTVQWMETWIGGVRTWVPKTWTFHFDVESQAPLPGKGQIGMGTLTGRTGVTRTLVVGAAHTQTAAWMKGVVAAVGVGIAGILV